MVCDLYASILEFSLGVQPPGPGMFHVTEAGHGNLQLRRPLLQSREAAIARGTRSQLGLQSIADLQSYSL